MGKPIESIVIVHFDETGDQSFYVCGDERVRLFIVDERAPNDRVYEWLTRAPKSEIAKIIGDGPIGSSADSRHEAIKARILGIKPKIVREPTNR